MNKLNFRILLLSLTVLLCNIDSVYSQKIEEQTLFGSVQEMASVHQDSTSLYEQRLERYKKRWERLIPSFTKVQFAGSMGLISAGVGWSYGKNKQWETDFLVGFVPKYETKSNKITFTLKQNFTPWRIHIKDSRFSFHPLSTGLYLNTVAGGDFWVNEPEKYPSEYYSFSTKLRINIFLGQRITYNFKDQNKKWIPSQSVSFFYELSTNELYLISAFTNRYITAKDYLHLSLGVKFQFL